MLDLGVQLSTLAAAITVMGITWVVSVAIRNASIADIVWGPAFAAIAWTAHIAGPGAGDRSLVIALLVTVWAARLGGWIAYRNSGEGEDPRYVAMRERHGGAFPLRSLWSVFGIQGAIAWFVSLPVQVAATDGTPEALGVLAFAGGAVFAVGLFFEAVSDFQLDRFKRNPLSRGAVLSSGLWRYSRHPNYFGDACVWWGIWTCALETGSAWWTAIGPAVMTFFLLRVSGVALTEKTIASRRPGYSEYIERTSAFIPRPPRSP